MEQTPTIHDVFKAHARIKHKILETPLISSQDLVRETGAKSVHLKLECLQNTGAFKVRGAANKILSLSDAEKEKGVITFSTGNHGKAVAYVAGRTGIRAVVCLSEHVAEYRAEAIRVLGAEVVRKGQSQDKAEEYYHELTRDLGLVPVVPFDDPMVIAGQGTIGLEILSKLPDTDVLLIQLSGGGLLSGIAMTAKSINPNIQVVGVSLEQSPAMVESLKAGKPTPVEEKDSIADSLLGGVGVDNHYTLSMVKTFVDDHVLVSEEEIKAGMVYIFQKHRLVAEGAAVVGVAMLMRGKVNVEGKRVVTILTGSSVDSGAYVRILNQDVEDAVKRKPQMNAN